MKVSRFLGLAASLILTTMLATNLAACSSGTGANNGSESGTASGSKPVSAQSADSGLPSADSFPVEITHAFGTTVIPRKPTRVATIAWANQEVPLALGVVPVGMAAVSWGDDNHNGVLPWVEDRLSQLGAPTPALFDETDRIDFEAVAATRPDVILAAYSGLTQEEYTTLSKIAPVVAYPEVPWATSMDDMIRMDSRALGLSAQGDALIADLHRQVSDALAQQPGLKDKKILFAFIDPTDMSQIGFYTLHDTRPGFLRDIGLPQPSVVEDATATTDAFYTTVSAEQADRFQDVDVFVTYGDPGSDMVARLQADPLLSKIPAIAAGNIVILENDTPLAASANPSPLSIPWGISDYFALLAGGTGSAHASTAPAGSQSSQG